ncbi:hypothetical protein AAFP30_17070 [Gordonia sp. CPCC 205515]|uniref:hypothetical protein n=1 Tax=Gordonia sp. CPCC 205515 TaxID=3140791 RepID=UPI003AF3F90C
MTSRILSVRAATILLASALIVVAVLGGVLVWMLRAVATDEAVETSRHELREAAGKIVAQVFSVDSDSWAADRKRARGLVGGRFATNHATELTRPPAAGVRSVVWVPDAVGVTDADADHGDTLIRATVTTTPVSGPVVVEQHSVTAQFEHIDGRWVLGDLEVLQ